MEWLFSSPLNVIIGLGLAAVALTYGGLPLLLYFVFRLKSPTTVLLFQPEALQLPKEVLAYVVPAGKQLKGLGFQPIAHFCLPDLVQNAKSISAMWVNAETLEAALVNCIFAQGGGVEVKNFHVEFVTRFRDGSCVMTNNTAELSAFCSPSNHYTIKFWDIQDVNRLHRLHGLLCHQLGHAPKKLTVAEDYHGDVESYINQEVIRVPAEYQVERGRFRRVPEGYAMTVFGAFLMGWQEVWPFKLLRRQKAWHTSRNWLAKLGET